MKKYRVMLLVIFMLSLSLLGFVSQGEEPVKVNEVENNDFVRDLTEIKLGTEVPNTKSVAMRVYDYANLENTIEQPTLNEFEKLAGVYEAHNEALEQAEIDAREELEAMRQAEEEAKAKAEAEALAEKEAEELRARIQKIVDLTPLDFRTAKVVIKYSDIYNIRPSLILGVMDLESNFNQYLVGTSDDRGYMQVIPGTEKWLVDKYGGELGIAYDPSRIFEAEYNIPLAVKFLSILKVEFDSNETKMLTAYNRGSGGLRKWYKEHGTYETAYSRVVLKRAEKYLDVN